MYNQFPGFSTGSYTAAPAQSATGAYNAAAAAAMGYSTAQTAATVAPYFSQPTAYAGYTQQPQQQQPQQPQQQQQTTTTTFLAPQSNRGSAGGATAHKSAASHQQNRSNSSSTAQSPARTNAAAGAGGATTYTGYDAAVYAAATSYLQSKATGGGSQWLGLKRGGGRGGNTGSGGGFPYKGRGGGGGGYTGGGGGSTQQMHYCDVCKISCAGPQTYKEHLEGQRHKKKEALLKGVNTQPLAKDRSSFRCDLCQVTTSGKDTYDAHIRGQKHMKAVKLHERLGKPIPGGGQPTILNPTASSDKGPTTKKVIGVPQMNFVGGAKLTTGGSAGGAGAGIGPQGGPEAGGQQQQQAIVEDGIQPVGEDYIEPIKDHTGKLVQYHCKLCDCKFTDINAKDMHLKGRRHRLSFKQKVNPDLEVEVKPNQMNLRMRRTHDEKQRRDLMRMRQQELWSMRAMYTGQMTPSSLMGANVGMPQPMFGGAMDGRRTGDGTSDDRHVMAKHSLIYPTEDQLSCVQKMVINTEKALKIVSDHFAEEQQKSKAKPAEDKPAEAEKKDEETAKEAAVEEKKETKPAGADDAERLLKGVMRVGLLAKGLLLRGDTTVALVVLCSDIPTKKLLGDVAKLLGDKFKEVCDEKYSITQTPEQSSIVVKSTDDPIVTCNITLTSVAVREQLAGDTTAVKVVDALPAKHCLDALAELRHAKWFQARCSNLQSCLVTLRIMRDICQRIPTWAPMTLWSLELLVEKVLTSCGVPMGPGDALRRVFEAVSAGILLPNGPGLLDPCEKDVVDALKLLTPQQREDITSSAQHALRLIAFNQLYKILAIDRIPDRKIRKRPRETNGTVEPDAPDGKKDKKDPEEKAAE